MAVNSSNSEGEGGGGQLELGAKFGARHQEKNIAQKLLRQIKCEDEAEMSALKLETKKT